LPNQFEPDNLDLAQPFYCWLRTGHGEMNLVSGLANSCDVYFYQVGGGYPPAEYEGLGLSRMVRYAEMFGLGAQTGIDLPGEVAGLVPNEKWKRLNYAETWLTGDTYNMAIGQGFALATPLQMLNATAAIANGGTLYRPFLVKEILDADDKVVKITEPQVIRHLDVEPQFIALVQEGLRAVIEWENGTARDTFDVPGIIASGKTGTAEYCDQYPQCLDRDGRVRTSHAWFTAYAPSNNPEIATVVFVYGGDEGSQTAVPVANKMLRYYFGIADNDEEADDRDPVSEEEENTPPAFTFIGRLLAADGWSHDGASVSGFILDAEEQGIANVIVDILANDIVVEQVVSGQNGQFDYNALDPSQAQTWELRLPEHPDTPLLQLEIAQGLRYLVEFKAQPPADAGPTPEDNSLSSNE
jgi:penicillin-binding protein 2